jgi:regulator of sirC expression with transglutaminase-like and TPR domain
MRIAALVYVLCGCAAGCAPSRPTPLTDQLMAAARDWSTRHVDETRARAGLIAIAADVARAARQKPEALPSTALNETIFGKWRFVREVDDPDLRFALLPDVLQSRRGSCVGLGSLYLAVAEQLGWRLNAVMVPGHFFVRIIQRGRTHNLELLRRGEVMPDSWYRERFPIPGGAAREYGRALSIAEVVGVVEYDAGNHWRRQGQVLEARHAYDRARKHFPDFAEAHASRGAIAQLLGELDDALLNYRSAQRANAHLPGVAQNIGLLELERARTATSRR